MISLIQTLAVAEHRRRNPRNAAQAGYLGAQSRGQVEWIEPERFGSFAQTVQMAS